MKFFIACSMLIMGSQAVAAESQTQSQASSLDTSNMNVLNEPHETVSELRERQTPFMSRAAERALINYRAAILKAYTDRSHVLMASIITSFFIVIVATACFCASGIDREKREDANSMPRNSSMDTTISSSSNEMYEGGDNDSFRRLELQEDSDEGEIDILREWRI